MAAERHWYALAAALIAVGALSLAYGDAGLRWTAVGFAIGILTTVPLAAFPGRLPMPPPARWRLPAALIPLAAGALLATSGLPRAVALAAGLVLGLAVGWAGVPRAFPPAQPLVGLDVVGPTLLAGTLVLSWLLTPAPTASALLLGSLVLLALGVAAIVVVGAIRGAIVAARYAKGRSGIPAAITPPAHAYRWFLLAALSAVAAFAVGSHDLTRVDGRLQGRVEAIAELEHGDPLDTMAVVDEAEGDLREVMLMRTFAPRLFLPTDQSAWPQHPIVDVLDSEVIDTATHPQKHWQMRYPPALPRTCSYPRGSSCVLTDHCFSEGPTCGGVEGKLEWPYGIYIPPGGNTTDGYFRPYGVVYARILHRNGKSLSETAPSARAAFENVELADRELGEPVTDLVQYWMYYRYDDWRAETALGTLIQEHESDWEAITVGFARGRPLFVAYNAHCGGVWLRWHDVPAVRTAGPEEFILGAIARRNPDVAGELGRLVQAGRHEATHPAVMVAAGSQGNYPASSRIRVPDWTSCPFGRSFGDVFAAASSIRERVDVSVEVVPAEVFLARLDSLPMMFGGRWGLNSRQRLITPIGLELRVGGGRETPGPPAPPRQGIWTDPFGTIFDSSAWREGVK